MADIFYDLEPIPYAKELVIDNPKTQTLKVEKYSRPKKSTIFLHNDRYLVRVHIGGGRYQPFYNSAGQNPKPGVKKGGWYPVFGLEIDSSEHPGWIRKTDQVGNYYGREDFRAAAERLDRELGDLSIPENRAKVEARIGRTIPRPSYINHPEFVNAFNEGQPELTYEARDDGRSRTKMLRDYLASLDEPGTNAARLKRLFNRENNIQQVFMEESLRRTGIQRPANLNDVPELRGLGAEISALIEAKKTLNLSASNESQNLYGDDDWVPPKVEEELMFGPGKSARFKPSAPDGSIPTAPEIGSTTTGGRQVVGAGDFVREWLETPGGLNLGFGTGATVGDVVNPYYPGMPRQGDVSARYHFRAVGPAPKFYGSSNNLDLGANQNINTDDARASFDRTGIISQADGGRAFFNAGNIDPHYLDRQRVVPFQKAKDRVGGSVFVIDSKKANYTKSTEATLPKDSQDYVGWKFKNPSYSTFEANIPSTATPLERALWQMNPMNRTGIAVFNQKFISLKDIPKVTGEQVTRKLFVRQGGDPSMSPALDIDGAVTVPLESSGNVEVGGRNQHGEAIDVNLNKARTVAESKAVTVDVDNPVYDRITPFTQRPLRTHRANLAQELRIATSTVPTAGKELGKAALRNPAPTLLVAGAMSDALLNYQRSDPDRGNPDPEVESAMSKLARGVYSIEQAAINIIDPIYQGKGMQDIAMFAAGLEDKRMPSSLSSVGKSPDAGIVDFNRSGGNKDGGATDKLKEMLNRYK